MWKMVFISCYAIYKPCGVLNVIIKRYDRMSKSCCCLAEENKGERNENKRWCSGRSYAPRRPEPCRVWWLGFQNVAHLLGVPPYRLGGGGGAGLPVMALGAKPYRIVFAYPCFTLAFGIERQSFPIVVVVLQTRYYNGRSDELFAQWLNCTSFYKHGKFFLEKKIKEKSWLQQISEWVLAFELRV